MTRGIAVLIAGFLTMNVVLLGACGDDGAKADGDGSISSDAAPDTGILSDSGRDAGTTADGSAGDGSSSDGSTTLPEDCAPLPAPEGQIVHVTVQDAPNLAQMVRDAAPGTTFLLEDGTYDMSGGDSNYRLQFRTPNLTLRSASGDPQAVILDGGYQTHELVSISASNVTIAELTLQKAYDHPIHVTGGSDADIEGTTIYRVRVIDPGQQGIKVNSTTSGHYTDNGRIECSTIVLTDQGRTHIRDNCYTGGIDMHKAWGWVVRLNHIEGFWCESGLSEHGIHLWRQCRDTLVERNQILDCARGIGFGLSQTPDDHPRVYPDNPYPDAGYMDHIDGIIRNNMVAATISGFDSGITLWAAHGAQVYHNTVVALSGGFSGIEWRFSSTSGRVINNLSNMPIMARDDVPVEAAGNKEDADVSVFVDPASGDLHLDPNSSAAGAVIDAGQSLDPGLCDGDYDGQSRDQNPDIGADEIGE